MCKREGRTFILSRPLCVYLHTTLHYITLHYITLHYVHPCMHRYLIHTLICTYLNIRRVPRFPCQCSSTSLVSAVCVARYHGKPASGFFRPGGYCPSCPSRPHPPCSCSRHYPSQESKSRLAPAGLRSQWKIPAPALPWRLPHKGCPVLLCIHDVPYMARPGSGHREGAEGAEYQRISGRLPHGEGQNFTKKRGAHLLKKGDHDEKSWHEQFKIEAKRVWQSYLPA